MGSLEEAKQLLKPSEKAVVLFTRGEFQEIENRNTGRSGKWNINTNREFDKAIIYLRIEGTQSGKVFKASITDISPADEKRRYWLHLNNIESIGVTNSNWNKFANTGSKPVKYI